MYEIFLTLMRWIHATATIAWIGGGLFYLLVLQPATRGESRSAWRQVSPAVGSAFAEVAQLAMFGLIISGAILTVDRLTSNVASVLYVAVLALKITLALWAFVLVWRIRSTRRRAPASSSGVPAGNAAGSRATRASLERTFDPVVKHLRGPNLIAVLGLLVVLLADVLKVLAESSLGYR